MSRDVAEESTVQAGVAVHAMAAFNAITLMATNPEGAGMPSLFLVG
jgi:hypothetical protein